jgi:hypothetical protein
VAETHHEGANEVHEEEENDHVEQTRKTSKHRQLQMSAHLHGPLSEPTKRGFILGKARMKRYHLSS